MNVLRELVERLVGARARHAVPADGQLAPRSPSTANAAPSKLQRAEDQPTP